MKKTTKKVVVKEAPAPKKEIGLLSLSFGTEDMNKLVEKVNEIIVNANVVL